MDHIQQSQSSPDRVISRPAESSRTSTASSLETPPNYTKALIAESDKQTLSCSTLESRHGRRVLNKTRRGNKSDLHVLTKPT